MIRDLEHVTALLEHFNAFVLYHQLTDDLPQYWTKFKAVTGTTGTNQNVLFWGCPIYNEILSFCRSVIAFLYLVQLYKFISK
jgi:hypothetical protein